MKGYAYLDHYRILHVVSDKETALKHSFGGIVVETDIEYSGGYPIIHYKVVDENRTELMHSYSYVCTYSLSNIDIELPEEAPRFSFILYENHYNLMREIRDLYMKCNNGYKWDIIMKNISFFFEEINRKIEDIVKIIKKGMGI